MADGTIGTKAKNKLYPRIILKLKLDDADHVAAFTEFANLEPDRCKISYKEGVARVGFTCRDSFDSLHELGIKHRKTYDAKCAPVIEDNRYFWCGFIDGDGCINPRNVDGNTYWGLSCVGAAEVLINQFCKFVERHCGFKPLVAERVKKNTNYTVQIAGKKAVSVMQVLYGGHRLGLKRKRELAEAAAQRYGTSIDGELINWQTTTGIPGIRKSNNPKVTQCPWEVRGPHEFYVGSFQSKEIATDAVDLFNELVDSGVDEEVAKAEVVSEFRPYQPKRLQTSMKSRHSQSLTGEFGITYCKKWDRYEGRLYYPSKKKGVKGLKPMILRHSDKCYVRTVMEIAVHLRQANYRFPNKRERLKLGGFVYDNALPANWAELLAEILEEKVIAQMKDEVEHAFLRTKSGANL